MEIDVRAGILAGCQQSRGACSHFRSFDNAVELDEIKKMETRRSESYREARGGGEVDEKRA